jgi:hypothetical protein
LSRERHEARSRTEPRAGRTVGPRPRALPNLHDS